MKAAPPIPGARTGAFFDDITVFLPLELAFDMEDIVKIAGWVQARLLREDIMLSWSNSKVLFHGGVEAEDLSADRRTELARTELVIVERRMRMVGVPIRTH